MYTNVNLAAPIGVLAFLGTGFVLLGVALTFFYGLATRKSRLTRMTPLAATVVAGTYLGVMLIFSFASSQTSLSRGQEKHFCEIDCHLAYSILDVSQTKTLGAASDRATAAGTFYVVTIKTRFDETTISATRGNGLLYPNSRVLTIIDENGRRYSSSADGQRVLEQSHDAGTAITTPLRPGESYTSRFVFDLPSDVRTPELLINEGDWVTRWVIGHENSFAHKKTLFQI